MFNRMRLVVVAALVATAPLAISGSAHAVLAAGEASTAWAERTISIKGVEPRDGVFFVKGQVKPHYKERFAIVQRRLKSEMSWDNLVTFTTNADSTYRERIHALKRPGVVCYRVKTRGNDSFKTSYSARVCLRTFRS